MWLARLTSRAGKIVFLNSGFDLDFGSGRGLGLGCGLDLMSLIILLNRRALAVGIAVCGTGVGTLVLPPLVEWAILRLVTWVSVGHK